MDPQSPMRNRQNVTSQWGEDGVIKEIFRRIGARNSFCVEFGAWDGRHLSNTWDLWHNQGWSAVLIEGESDRFRTLQAEVAAFPSVQAVCAFVTVAGPDSLDAILGRCGVPIDLDLLSIDVDGDDYYIFESLAAHQPRVVLIEFNPTVPPKLDLVQAPGTRFGASVRAVVELARRKGYQFVGCTVANGVFVRSEEFPSLGVEEPDLDAQFSPAHLTYVMTSYDGEALLSRQPTYSALLTTDTGADYPRPRVTTGPSSGGVVPVRIRRASNKSRVVRRAVRLIKRQAEHLRNQA